MIDLAWQELRTEIAAIVDTAAKWAFTVERRIMQATGNPALASTTANKVYTKILEQQGVNGHGNR